MLYLSPHPEMSNKMFNVIKYQPKDNGYLETQFINMLNQIRYLA